MISILHLVGTTGNGAGKDDCFQCDSVLLCIDSHCTTLRIVKDTETKQRHEKQLQNTPSLLK
jgi:hypothetical protein